MDALARTGQAAHTPPPATSAEVEARVEAVLARLRADGGRATNTRRILLRALFGTAGHRSAEQLLADIRPDAPDLHLSTIYRNLDELERLGIVVAVNLRHGPTLYHLAAQHAHIICEHCGTVYDIPDHPFQELARLARQHWNITVTSHHFTILGTCPTCTTPTTRPGLRPQDHQGLGGWQRSRPGPGAEPVRRSRRGRADHGQP